MGLGAVCYAAGFDTVEIGQWGNMKYINQTMNTKSWPDYRRLRRGLHSRADLRCPFHLFVDGLRNDFQNPADAWILARKPDEGV